ncbi:AAA family ATPase [Dethiosulfovibrio sp. F2B]|uniref:AAA family ATPase n=1 Tax=Dethiosulfovibrio faecalis TaxID=2720018 RepID=UPI001F3EE4FA|nr:ATP-binding protein [Dethiosulfovibrio faecalis]MCF4150899.1 AAA family ATPase [Dethiosulfovibrio faecalis]
MIKSISIKKFKSLVDMELELSDFTCLIGLNGSGKSTVLQAIDFIGQMMRGKLSDWARSRRWNWKDIPSRLGQRALARVISFKVTAEVEAGITIVWDCQFNCAETFLRCTKESVKSDSGDVFMEVKDGHYRIGSGSLRRIEFDYQGSILSQLKDSSLDEQPELLELKRLIGSIKSMDLLSPPQMRERARSVEEVGPGGEGLSAFIDGMIEKERRELVDALREIYPHLMDIETKSLRSGWKELKFKERYEEELVTEAHHMNDGTLRLATIFALLARGDRILLFDEIENGINPEVMERLVQRMVESHRQVIVTTHSPMILNYLSDEVAERSVILLYKNRDGHTKSTRFFDLPDVKKKLTLLGPGEVFLDSDLREPVEIRES